MTAESLPTRLTDLDDVRALWSSLHERAAVAGRALWIVFHDADGHVRNQLTEIADLPLRPDETAVTSVEAIVRGVVAQTPDVDAALLLLVRGGDAVHSPFEEAWADALTLALDGVLRWPVHYTAPAGVDVVPLWTRSA